MRALWPGLAVFAAAVLSLLCVVPAVGAAVMEVTGR